jgi:hypothetical protein
VEAYANADRSGFRTAPPSMSFGAWSDRQRAALAGDRLDALVQRWRAILGPDPEVLGAPLPSYRSDVVSPGAQHLDFTVDVRQTAALRALSRSAGVTMFETTLAALARVLCAEIGRTWLACRTSVANRWRREEREVVGPLSHQVHLRVDLSGCDGLAAAARRVPAAAAAGHQWGAVQHTLLRERLWPGSTGLDRRTPMLYFTLNPDFYDTLPLPGLQVVPVEFDWLQAPPLSLETWMVDKGATLDGTFRWERGRLDPAVADSLVERFHAELAAA